MSGPWGYAWVRVKREGTVPWVAAGGGGDTCDASLPTLNQGITEKTAKSNLTVDDGQWQQQNEARRISLATDGTVCIAILYGKCGRLIHAGLARQCTGMCAVARCGFTL